MNNPFPGMKITINNDTNFKYLNSYYEKIDIVGNKNEVTNYEYEIDLNESKRGIHIIKPEYLGVFIEDFKNIMNYDKSTETVNSKLKRVVNPKLIE